MRIVLEALSDLYAQLTLTPSAKAYAFGDRVRVDVSAATSAGTPAGLRVTGSVKTASGGMSPITFNGLQGVFDVPAVPGRHTVVVRVETTLSKAEATAEYDAFRQPPPALRSSRDLLRFNDAFGPANPDIAEPFKLFPEFPTGTKALPVRVSYTGVSPAGIAELSVVGGSVLRPGVTQFVLPPQGLDLVLHIRMDPQAQLPKQSDHFKSMLQFSSTEAEGLDIPFELDFRLPRFEISNRRDTFSLWWDPYRERVTRLGALHTDLVAPGKFFVTIPEAINAPDQGPKIADLALVIPADAPEPKHDEPGKLRYGPLELQPGHDFPIELKVTPTRVTGWEKLPAAAKGVPIELQSELGMKTAMEPKFWTVGGSLHDFFGFTWSRYGRHCTTVLFFLVLFVALIVMAKRRIGALRHDAPFRADKMLMLRFGAIQTGDPDAAALGLPNTSSPLDNATLGHVFPDRRGQRIQDASGYLQFSRPVLSTADVFGIVNPVDPTQQELLWEFEYTGFDPTENAGDIVVTRSPVRWTPRRLFRWFVMSGAVLLVCAVFLASSVAAWLAYRLGFIESLYLYFLQP